jgi:predicted MFS family arabinose efflux permease
MDDQYHPTDVLPSIDRRSFGVILFSRFALNMQMRVIYPFLPAISRGLGVPLETTSLLLTARAVANLISPLFGVLSDRFGRRALMLAGLGILVGGSFLVVLAPSFWAVLASIAFLSLCKAVYDPAVLAYLGDVVPYSRRGRVMGILALMWPTSWFIGIPIAGYMIDRIGWRSPFVFIGLLGAVSLVLMLRAPAIGTHLGSLSSAVQKMGSGAAQFFQSLSSIGKTAWLALTISLLLVMSSENVYIIYGAWLEDQFSLSVTALGFISIVISLAEFTSEGTSAGWLDRIGKRRAVMVGLTLNGAAYLVLPAVAQSLAGAVVGLFLVYLTFDFSIVSLIPIISELSPTARGALLALNVAAMAVGRLLSSLGSARLWNLGGLQANALLSAFLILAGLLILVFFVRERQPAAAFSKP